MERRAIFLSLGMVFFLCLPLCVHESLEHKYHKEPRIAWERLAKKLNLSEEQEKKLEENREKQHKIMSELFKALREEQEKLHQELGKSELKREKVQPLLENIKSLQGKILEQKIEGIFAIKEILTPEQFTKFQEMTQKRMKHKGKGWHRPHRELER
ncbi:MAG: periplasmic heavy metal sensor [Candidatus Omnitrophica bacterium]|nr:periplasmic heavy metal sensor [Candidatus Omnitrophota bacterium]